jgi:predicted AlkP superfamily phosphohydrolase/phosphomutase
MGSVSRVCVVGLDAVDEAMVESWCAEGALPALDRLRHSGVWIPLRHADAYPSASVWPTIYTGTPPGHHAIVYPVGIVPGTLALESVVPEASAEPPVWSRLSAAGLRSIVVDVPFAPLGPDKRTVQILDWGAYERPGPPRAWPPDALAGAIEHAGPYPLQRDLSRDPASTEAERRRDHASLVAGVAVKGAAVRWLLRHRPWDFFMANFTEAHAVGHHYWGVGPAWRHGGPGEAVQEVYRAIDVELARLLDVLDLTTTTLIVLSGHGMGRNFSGWHLMEPLLRRLGLLVSSPATPGSALARLRQACPARVRRVVSRWLPSRARVSMSQYWLLGSLDLRRTRAFALPSDQLGFVRLNVAGREPDGVVQPGGEYATICGDLAGSLRGLVDLETERPVVSRVFDADQTFPGPHRDRLPDLLVKWNEEATLEAVRAPGGQVTRERPRDPRSGNHRPEGFALVCGAGLPRSRAASGHLLDVTPTILASFGLEPAAAMPGRAWLPAPFPGQAAPHVRSA